MDKNIDNLQPTSNTGDRHKLLKSFTGHIGTDQTYALGRSYQKDASNTLNPNPAPVPIPSGSGAWPFQTTVQ